MFSIIAGTAGHIDHGKTALVRALTGMETDRMAEEKRRGISIALGFAHTSLPGDVEVSFIDVPGHERFVKTMVAGVAGVDVVLLIIACNEGVMPQTREHFEICKLLGARQGILLLSKCDLVEASELDRVRQQALELVRGTFLGNAPILAVSARTGQGLDELRAELQRLALDPAPRSSTGAFRLPIDRCFAMKGFGTVITGTAVSGSIGAEQEIEIYPIGRKARVRGVQVHGAAVQRAGSGSRIALNLSGIDAAIIARGMTAAAPAVYEAATVFDCHLNLLQSAPPLRHRSPVHFHCGAAECVGEVWLGDGARELQPGGNAYVRLRLRAPMLALPGDRFVIRRFSPVSTTGGGSVLRIAEGKLDPPLLASWEAAGPAARTAMLVKTFSSAAALQKKLGYPPVLSGGVGAAGDFLFSNQWADEAGASIEGALRQHHSAEPLSPGLQRESVRKQLSDAAPPDVFDAVISRRASIVSDAGILRLSGHRVEVEGPDEAAQRRMLAAFRGAGFTTPAVKEVLADCGVEPRKAQTLLRLLLKEKRLVRINEDLVYHPEVLSDLKSAVAGKRGRRFQVGDFKEWTGVSRKYAIPLLEFLDRERVTRREGNDRVVV